jgi:glycosyltransferase involved in cell wall biosynthesis
LENLTDIELTILMPCLNEAETIGACITKALSFLQSQVVSGEVLIADNGSTDGSREIASGLGARVVEVPLRGYGAALMGGIQAARGRLIIMGDADDSYDFSCLMPMLADLRNGADLVMGNRFTGGIKPGAMPWLHRYLGNPVLSSLGRLFFRIKVGDFHSGLRGFKKESVLALDLRTTGMEFASEMVVKASLKKMTITEVPTILYPDGRSRPPHLRTWRDGWRHLRFLLLYSPNWLFFYPGMIALAIGLVGMLWLLPGPRNVGFGTLDINTLLFASAAILIGLQSIFFSLFTKVFAMSEGLLPSDQRLLQILGTVSLERGLIVGVGFSILGIIGSLAALSYWKAHSFGPLDPSIAMRIVIPGTTLITAGFQVTLSSFFLSILGLARKINP